MREEEVKELIKKFFKKLKQLPLQRRNMVFLRPLKKPFMRQSLPKNATRIKL